MKEIRKYLYKFNSVLALNKYIFLNNLCNLTGVDEKFKKCTIIIDRNIKQREEVKKLVEEAKLKSVNSSNKHYLVRGSPFKPYIIEMPKKIGFLRHLNIGKLIIFYIN